MCTAAQTTRIHLSEQSSQGVGAIRTRHLEVRERLPPKVLGGDKDELLHMD